MIELDRAINWARRRVRVNPMMDDSHEVWVEPLAARLADEIEKLQAENASLLANGKTQLARGMDP